MIIKTLKHSPTFFYFRWGKRKGKKKMGWKEHEFSKNYVILKPHNANLLDLFLFILPFGFKRRKLMDCPDDKQDSYRSFADRLIIFISMLLQLFLLAIATPLANLDAFLEKLFNFISFNGSIRQLLLKLIQGTYKSSY